MSFLSGTKSTQSTQNQQVGVSGSGVGISGSTFGGAGGNIRDINFVTSDAETVQLALSSNAAVAEAGINGANQAAIGALATLERQQDRQNAVVAGALSATQDLAKQVAPVSEGSLVQNLQAGNNKVIIAAVISLAVIGGIIYYKS